MAVKILVDVEVVLAFLRLSGDGASFEDHRLIDANREPLLDACRKAKATK